MNLFNSNNRGNNNFSGNSWNNRSNNSFQGNLFGPNNNNNNSNMRSGNNSMFGNQGSNNNNLFGSNNNRNNLFGSNNNNNSNSNGNNGLGLLGSSSNSNNFMGMNSGSSIGTFNYGYDPSKLPKTEKEGYPIMAINANASLKHKSLDELRVEDYFSYKGNKIPQQNLNIIHDQWQKNINGRGQNGGNNNFLGGNNNNNNGGGNNLFGRNNNNNGGNLFGGNNNNNGGGLFGNNNNNNNNRGGLFGSNNNNNGGGGLFGSNNNNNNRGGLFGSNNNNNGGGLFGSNNNNNGGGLFGSNNNNNRGGLFGSNNNGGGLFGSNNNNNNNRGGLFGNSNGGGLFGSNNNNNGGGLFGNKGGLFGSNNNNNNGGGLFGGQRQGGLFSGLNNNNGGGLFGSSNNNNNNNNNNNGSSGYYNNEAQLLLEAQKLLGAIDMEQAKNFDAIRLNFGTTQQNYNLFGKSVGASSESTKEFLGRYEAEEQPSTSVVTKRTHRSGYKSSSRKTSFYGEGDADSQLLFRNKGFHSRLRDTGSHLLARKANSEDFIDRDRADSWHDQHDEVGKRLRLNSYTEAYHVEKSSIDLTSMYDSIRIYVFLNQEGQEKNCSLNVCFSKTCLEIKRIALEKLFDETEAPLSKYKLVFNNRILRDTTKVKDTQLKDNDKIYIIPDSESDNYSYSSFSSPSKEHLASESLLPKLTKEYHTEPSMPRISRMTADELRNIENFTIFNEYVKVTFEGLTDITGLNLDEIVHLKHRSIEVYPENGRVALPQTGYELNKAATIEFYQWSVPKKYQSDLRSYDVKLKNWADSIGAEFVSFDASQGVVCIRVYNFNIKSQ